MVTCSLMGRGRIVLQLQRGSGSDAWVGARLSDRFIVCFG